MDDADLVAIGRQVYQEGRLASGEPVRATVQGDVEIEGSQFTCRSCHRRSGMGAVEGDRIAMAISGLHLFRARESGYAPRPAYTEETLARMVRDGIDAAGRSSDPLMPLYALPDREMRGLIAYLKTLSTEPSPGLTDEEIRFATVVAGDVDPGLRDAMMEVLETFFDEKNRGTRNEVGRRQSGPFYRRQFDEAYRRWVLDTWELEGAPQTWPAQLEEHYRAQPVFGIVSGIAAGDWRWIHTFCETRQLPCLLPNTDAPSIEEDDYYTLYLSKGLALEAQAIVRHVRDETDATRMLQVYREDGSGVFAARALDAAARDSRGLEPLEWVLPTGEELSAERLGQRLEEAAATTAVLWLGPGDLAQLGRSWQPRSDVRVYLSSTFLEGDLAAVPAILREGAFAAHPYTLPDELDSRAVRIRAWLRSRRIDGPHERIRAQTYFACMVTGGALDHIRRNFYRDYFMDSIEHESGMAVFSAFYPRLSFGPEQRYLAKGCYIVPLAGEPDRPMSERASWIVP